MERNSTKKRGSLGDEMGVPKGKDGGVKKKGSICQKGFAHFHSSRPFAL